MESINNKHLLFITTSNLSTNPRLVKEIKTAVENGFHVITICFKYNNWSEDFDNEWIIQHPEVKVIKISANRNSFLPWFSSSFIEWICSKLFPFMDQTMWVNVYASSKRSFLLKSYLLKSNFKIKDISLVIAHNLGALYPAWKFSKKIKVPFIFDLEDYHPGENIGNDNINEKQRREFLLQKLLPDAAIVTIASPLIGKQIKTLVGEHTIKNITLINNCFPSNEFEYFDSNLSLSSNQIKSSSNHIIHFVWFSQNIAANRGLELIIPEFAKIKDKVHLHLMGNLYDDFNRNWVVPNYEFITIYPPMSQKELNRFICQFDVGLAIEPGKDENNRIAVSNKIWVYLQAGIYILATDTPAQVGFMKEHEGHGVAFEISTQKHKVTEIFGSIFEAITEIINNIEKIREHKLERFEKAKEFSWEKESFKLQGIWNKILNKQ